MSALIPLLMDKGTPKTTHYSTKTRPPKGTAPADGETRTEPIELPPTLVESASAAIPGRQQKKSPQPATPDFSDHSSTSIAYTPPSWVKRVIRSQLVNLLVVVILVGIVVIAHWATQGNLTAAISTAVATLSASPTTPDAAPLPVTQIASPPPVAEPVPAPTIVAPMAPAAALAPAPVAESAPTPAVAIVAAPVPVIPPAIPSAAVVTPIPATPEPIAPVTPPGPPPVPQPQQVSAGNNVLVAELNPMAAVPAAPVAAAPVAPSEPVAPVAAAPIDTPAAPVIAPATEKVAATTPTTPAKKSPTVVKAVAKTPVAKKKMVTSTAVKPVAPTKKKTVPTATKSTKPVITVKTIRKDYPFNSGGPNDLDSAIAREHYRANNGTQSAKR